MREPDDAVLKEITNALVTRFGAERVALFGSRARGDQREDSDYDIFVVIPDDAARRPTSLSPGRPIIELLDSEVQGVLGENGNGHRPARRLLSVVAARLPCPNLCQCRRDVIGRDNGAR